MSDVLTYIDFNTSDSILPGKHSFNLQNKILIPTVVVVLTSVLMYRDQIQL